MNNGGAPPPASDQSPLSLLVNAADSRDAPRAQGNDASGGAAARQALISESLRRTLAGEGGGLGGGGGAGGLSLEEQILLQQQLQGHFGSAAPPAAGPSPSSAGFLSQLQRDQALLSQIGHHQQLASLLGLSGSGAANDVHSVLAAAQLRQQQQHPQLSQADILSLSRSGIPGLSGLLSGGGLGALMGGGAPAPGGMGGAGLGSDFEGIHRLEELERRQRLLAAAGGGAPGSAGLSLPPAPSAAQPIAAPSAALARGMDNSSGRAAGGAPKLCRADSGDPRGAGAAVSSRNDRTGQTAKASQVAAAIPEQAESSPAGVGDEEKEELEKAPGSVIVPCRARGMPMDHNFKTAYFVIPENVKHGEELICSYFACRNAGIKFRYCSHCKVPVAKRNFRKRHKHGGEVIAKIPGEDSEGEEETAMKKGIPSQITANHKETVEAGDGISSQSTDSNPREKTDAEVQKGLVRSSVQTFETSKNHRAAAAQAAGTMVAKGDSKVSSARQKRWMNLLGKRPSTKDGDSMSTWLMEVLAVSDLDTPLKPTDNVVATVKDEDEREKSTKKADSPKSDNGYGSSNDDSNANGGGKNPGDKAASAGPAAFPSGLIKKKRPVEEEAKEGEGGSGEQPGEFFVSGSFAAWKERKKQKKQAKVNSSPSSPTE